MPAYSRFAGYFESSSVSQTCTALGETETFNVNGRARAAFGCNLGSLASLREPLSASISHFVDSPVAEGSEVRSGFVWLRKIGLGIATLWLRAASVWDKKGVLASQQPQLGTDAIPPGLSGASRKELEQIIRTAMKAWPATVQDCAAD
jgi:hypothetical protein